MKHRVSVSLDESTVRKILEMRRAHSFRSKSHVVEEAVLSLFRERKK